MPQMPPFEEPIKSDLAKGLAIGVAAAVVAPIALSALYGVGRPLARAAFKTGVLFYEKSRETMAEFGEVVEDLVAEARAELREEHLAVNQAAVAGAEQPEAASDSSMRHAETLVRVFDKGFSRFTSGAGDLRFLPAAMTVDCKSVVMV